MGKADESWALLIGRRDQVVAGMQELIDRHGITEFSEAAFDSVVPQYLRNEGKNGDHRELLVASLAIIGLVEMMVQWRERQNEE